MWVVSLCPEKRRRGNRLVTVKWEQYFYYGTVKDKTVTILLKIDKSIFTLYSGLLICQLEPVHRGLPDEHAERRCEDGGVGADALQGADHRLSHGTVTDERQHQVLDLRCQPVNDIT